MFGSKRHRQQAQPLTRETANPNAATAAAAVFLHKQTSTPTLSSAAAAAALKARPITPTNVAQVPSTRTHRRSPSVSSIGSRERSSRQSMRRSPSVSSMTERTFRSPSPGRSPAPIPEDVPPVPQIPAETQNRAHKKSLSVQTQAFRTASQKQNKKGTWHMSSAMGDPSNVRQSDAIIQGPYSPASERPSSPASINFSYPRGRVESPTPRRRSLSSSGVPDQTMVYDANSRRMVPRAELFAAYDKVREASEKPVKTKKKSDISRTLSHLSKGTMGRTRSSVTESVSFKPERASTLGAETTTKAPQTASVSREPTLVGTDSNNEALKETHQTGTEPNTGVTADISPEERTPGTVSEEPDRGGAGHNDKQSANVHAVDSLPVKTSSTDDHEPTKLESKHKDSVRRSRIQSESPGRSPGRSARFASASDQLTVRHEPPPRSLSPKKSALKSSLRDVSPSDDGSDASAARHAASDLDDTPQSKRRSVRVSFHDDETTIIGEAAPVIEDSSPSIPSPQVAKKTWASLASKFGRKDQPAVEQDETMSPRPTLPLFGSVRQKKVTDTEERALVRPGQPANRASSPDNPLAQSSDAVIGSVLSREQASRNEANISKAREPLPPVTLPVESTGTDSDDDLESDEEEVSAQGSNKVVPTVAGTVEHADLPTSVKNAAEKGPGPTEGGVPSIALQQPSPMGKADESTVSPDQEYFELPGGFPDDEGGDVTPTQGTMPAEMDPIDEEVDPSTPTRVQRGSVDHTPPMADITEESEDGSIYSDANETSDFEGDGFLSLDAVLESPSSSKVSERLAEKARAGAEEAKASEQKETEPVSEEQKLAAPDDWESAKAYWRSLSADKRKQLEREALDEAGEEGDIEGQDTPKKSKKKTAANQQPIETPSPDAVKDGQRVYQIQPGTQWTEDNVHGDSEAEAATQKPRPKSMGTSSLRKSMRGSPGTKNNPAATAAAAPPGLRKTLRAESEDEPAAAPTAGGFRKSMRTNGSPREKASARDRPMSYAAPSSSSKMAPARTRTQSADGRPGSATGTAVAMRSSLRRRGSDSSESSFTRARPATSSGMRTSMRGSMREAPAAAGPYSFNNTAAKGSSSRFSLRSLSPTPFRRNSFNATQAPPSPVGSGFGGSRLRMSMRENSEAKSKKRLSAFGKSKPAKESKRSSRFVDSSDEDERPTHFGSRFIDSSDDEEPDYAQSKGKGLPRTMRPSKGSSSAAAAATGVSPAARALSPDLADGDDAIVNPKRATVNGGMQRSRSGRGALVNTQPGTLDIKGVGGDRPANARRGSFMSSILRRKKDPATMISRDVTESAARRDTPLERPQDQIALMRKDSGQRLQKIQKEPSWPLPPPPPIPDSTDGAADHQRPATSSGPSSTLGFRSMRKGASRRRSTSYQGVLGGASAAASPGESEFPDDQSTIEGGGTKKKKFGGLRKMLGIKN